MISIAVQTMMIEFGRQSDNGTPFYVALVDWAAGVESEPALQMSASLSTVMTRQDRDDLKSQIRNYIGIIWKCSGVDWFNQTDPGIVDEERFGVCVAAFGCDA